MRTSPAPLKLFLAAYNNLLNLTTPSTPAYAGGNLATAAALVAAGRRWGLSWDELGLSPRHVGRGLRAGAAIGGPILAAYAAALALEPTRELLRDERAEHLTWGDVVEWALVRVPLGTVVLEELAFRGVLYGLERRQGAWQATLTSSALFAAWHVVVTWKTAAINEVDSRAGRTVATIAGCAATGLAGVLFCAVRERSSSVVAPAVVHLATNAGGAVAASLAHRIRG